MYDLLKNIENAGTLDFADGKFLEIEKQLDLKYKNKEIEIQDIYKYQQMKHKIYKKYMQNPKTKSLYGHFPK